jgi:hypothetical protein
MKIILNFIALSIILISFASCQNKIKGYLAKKWDCVQIENVTPIDKNFITKQDSVAAVQLETALKSLRWTFTKNNSYHCSLGDRVTTQGTYEISADEKIITLTSSSKNTVNTYIITSISEMEMTLTSTAVTVPVVMHFRPS